VEVGVPGAIHPQSRAGSVKKGNQQRSLLKKLRSEKIPKQVKPNQKKAIRKSNSSEFMKKYGPMGHKTA
jgi:hypothetical protein